MAVGMTAATSVRSDSAMVSLMGWRDGRERGWEERGRGGERKDGRQERTDKDGRAISMNRQEKDIQPKQQCPAPTLNNSWY